MEVAWLSPDHTTVVVEGKVYDLTDFLGSHPGGALFLLLSKGRDISVTLNTYHMRNSKVKAVLEKFLVGPADPQKLPEKYVLAEYRNSRVKIELPPPLFDFTKENQFQHEVIKAIDAKPELKKRLRQLDDAFLTVVWTLVGIYLAVSVGFMSGWLNPWVCVPVFAVLRLSLLAPGHYSAHEPQPNWRTCFLNIGYFGSSLKGPLIHSVNHHSFPGLTDDPKKTILLRVLQVPRLWRVPLQTMHWYLLFVAGLLIDGVKISWFLTQQTVFRTKLLVPVFSFWLVKAYLLMEMVISYKAGLLVPWIAQFMLTTWWNHAILLFSHDFLPMSPEDQGIQVEHSEDWGLFQIRTCNEMSFTGIPWVDCFISTGQSCHAVHHLLPWQRTGWANIATMPLVKKMALERKVLWKEGTPFLTTLIPKYIETIFMTPMMGERTGSFEKENFSWTALWVSLKYMYDSVIL